MKASILILLIIIFGLGCSEKDETPTPVGNESTVNFESTNKNLSEADEVLKVKITFDKPAPSNAVVKIKLSGSAVYPQDFYTNPESQEGYLTINVEKGAEDVSFDIKPVNDQIKLSNKSIIFSLENLSVDFKPGTKSVLTINLMDDDEEGNGNEISTIQFKETSATISEDNEQGIDVELVLDGQVEYTEFIFISIDAPAGLYYGTDYYIEPFILQEEIRVEVYPGMEKIKFTFYPMDNNFLSENFEFDFSILSTSDRIQKGERTTFNLTVLENDFIDPVLLHSIADLRDRFEEFEGDWYFPQDYYIEGVITSDKNVINDKTVYIQDETGGIMLVFNMENLLSKGDRVQINLKNASGHYVNQQKTITGVSDRLGILTATDMIVAPEVITLEDLATGNYEGRRVQIQNVSFYSISEHYTWFGSYSIKETNGDSYGVVTTYSDADFAQIVLPSGNFTLTGIVGSWGNIHPQVYDQDIIK